MSIDFKNTKTHYGLTGKLMHWTSVILVVTVIIVSSQFENLIAGNEKTRLVTLHSSIGIILFLLMLGRLTWRNININPIQSYSIRTWQKFVALSLHKSIYIVIISQCILGTIILFTNGKPIPFFEVFDMPPLLHENTQVNEWVIDSHHFISMMIYPLFAIHISAAIYHQIFGLIDD